MLSDKASLLLKQAANHPRISGYEQLDEIDQYERITAIDKAIKAVKEMHPEMFRPEALKG